MEKREDRAKEEATKEGGMEEAEPGSVGPEKHHNPMYPHQEIFSIPSGKD
jgi:hypothetical protein